MKAYLLMTWKRTKNIGITTKNNTNFHFPHERKWKLKIIQSPARHTLQVLQEYFVTIVVSNFKLLQHQCWQDFFLKWKQPFWRRISKMSIDLMIKVWY